MQPPPEPEPQGRPSRSQRDRVRFKFMEELPQPHTYEHDEYDSSSSTSRERIRAVPRGRGPLRRDSGIESLPETDGELYGSSTLYSYTPSRGASRYLSKGSSATATSGDEGASDDGTPAEPLTPAGAPPPLAYHVFESRYTRDGAFGGQHAAELSGVSDTKVKYQPLFRWV